METVVIVVLLLVVVAVAIDALARCDERRDRRRELPRDETSISTQKIIVDLTRRR